MYWTIKHALCEWSARINNLENIFHCSTCLYVKSDFITLLEIAHIDMSVAEEMQTIETLGFLQGWTSSSITDSGSSPFTH